MYLIDLRVMPNVKIVAKHCPLKISPDPKDATFVSNLSNITRVGKLITALKKKPAKKILINFKCCCRGFLAALQKPLCNESYL